MYRSWFPRCQREGVGADGRRLLFVSISTGNRCLCWQERGMSAEPQSPTVVTR